MFGCDTCQFSCPYNIEIENSKLEFFKPQDFFNYLDEDYIINMNNGQFKESLKKTSCGWRGKNILKRNAMIRKYIYKDEQYDSLKSMKFDSPYLNEYSKTISKIKFNRVLKK